MPGQVEGVEHEFSVANVAKRNWDGYQLALADVLQSRLSIATPFQYYRISQHAIYGKIICRIEVKPAPEAVYIEKKLLIREGNRTRELQGPDLIGYVTSHWKQG